MKKSIKVLVISCITLFICNILITRVYANNSCKIQTDLSSTYAKVGTEIEMSISISNINEAIAGVGFSLNYDTSILEIVKINSSIDWTITQTENFFTLFTKDYEATTKAGKIASIVFKVKNYEQATNTTAITLSSIQITKDDALVENLEEIKNELTTNISRNNNLTTNEKNSNTENNVSKLPNTGAIIGKGAIIFTIIIILALIIYKKRKK